MQIFCSSSSATCFLPLFFLHIVQICAQKKTVLITGANRGIGFAAVKQLAVTNNFNIILAARNVNLANKAVQSIPISQGRENIEIRALDLANLSSIESFAEEFKKKKKKIDIIACNAGVQHSSGCFRTSDGFEDTVGTNHLGHVLLLHRLLPDVLTSKGKIVFTASGVHNPKEPGGDVGAAVVFIIFFFLLLLKFLLHPFFYFFMIGFSSFLTV